MYIGVDNIMAAFDDALQATPYYSIWLGNNLVAQNNTDDLAAGRERIETLLTAMAQSGNSDLVTIKFHPDLNGSLITNKSPYVGMLLVRAISVGGTDGLNRVGSFNEGTMPYNAYKAMQDAMNIAVANAIAPLNEKIAALEAQPVEEKPAGALGFVSELLANPAVIEALLARFLPAIAGTPPPNPYLQQPMQVAGTPAQPEAYTELQMVEVTNNLNRLSEHCDLLTDLKLLADMAENNPQMFKMLLTSLRAQ